MGPNRSNCEIKMFKKFAKDWLLPPKVATAIKHLRGGRYYGVGNLDALIKQYVDLENGFYIEIGANNGIDQSNTMYFEKYRGWRGILIEPIPHKFLECRANRSPRNIFVCAACVSFDYSDKYVELEYSNLMTSSEILTPRSFNAKAHATSGYPDTISFPSRALTLQHILDTHAAPQTIDLFSLDVEGAELEVIGGIDFSTRRFSNIVVETWDIEAVTERMRVAGYNPRTQLSSHDYLFQPNSQPPAS